MAGLSAAAMNLFLPSLPAMALHYNVEYGTIGLSVGLYLAANAPMQIVIGPLSDRYGRRTITLWAFTGFLLASVGAILAPTVEVFLAMRMAQAVAVAGMVLSRAVVRDILEDQAAAASMIGYVTMGMAVVPMFAPVVGGVLDTVFGWQSSFIALAIMAGLMIALVWFDMGETYTPRKISIIAQIKEYPELLRSRRFWGYALIAGFSSGGFFAYLGGAPQIGSDVFGLTPDQVGLYFGTPAVGYMAGNYISGRFSLRFGIGRMIFAGSFAAVLGICLGIVVSLLVPDRPISFFAPMSLLGLGNGLVIPNAMAGMLSMRPHLAGSAAGLGGAIMLGGGAILSMLAGNVVEGATNALSLLALMLVSGVMAIAIMLYVRHVDRKEAAATA